MTLTGVIFVASFVGAVYFGISAVRCAFTPEFKADMERLREQRRRRKAARR